MDDSNRPNQQFYTDENGLHYSRYGGNSPWKQISQRSDGNAHLPSFHETFPPAGHMATASQYTFADYGPQPGLSYAQPFSQPIAGPSNQTQGLSNIDPALLPLPSDNDSDFPPPHKLLPTIARRAAKVAGSRRSNPDPKGKGKQVVRDINTKTGSKRKAATQAAPVEAKKARGRAVGAANYSNEDIWGLLDIVSECLPIGGKAWNTCADDFNEWAEENERPVRTSKSLEAKYKQLVKTKKPTGDAEMPDYVQQAHEIEDAINEKAGTRDLDDDDIADEAIEISSDDNDDDDADDERPKVPLKKPAGKKETTASGPTVTARRITSDRLTQSATRVNRNSKSAGDQLINTLSTALDPATQAARQDDRASRTFQATQLFTFSTQLRESQALVESLRTRLSESERERNAADRRADRAEMLSMLSGHRPRFERSDAMPHPPTPRPIRTPRRDTRVRHDIYYRDGGRAVRWVSADDSEPSYSPGTRVVPRYSPDRYPSPSAPRRNRPMISPSPLSARGASGNRNDSPEPVASGSSARPFMRSPHEDSKGHGDDFPEHRDSE